jgi:hypothetical protein
MSQRSYYRIPTDPDAKIWRYLTFDKYLSMLLDEGIWFARGDKLGDPYEGVISLPSFEELVAYFDRIHGTARLDH